MTITVLCYIEDLVLQKTLLLYRDGKKKNDIHLGKWNGLGGKVESGESPEDAVKREVREEAGLVLLNPRLRGHIVFPNFNDEQDIFMFVFTASHYQGQLRADCPEGRLEWIDNEQIPTLNMWEADHLFFEWLKRKEFFSAKINYQQKNYTSHEVFFY